jgi:HEAT repeat protein
MPALAPRAWGQFDSDMWRLDVERAALAAGQAISASALRGQAIAAEAMGRAMAANADAFRSFGGLDGLSALTPMAALAGGSASFRSSPPAPWKQADPADSLYREARKALSNDANQRAAELFMRIRNEYPRSAYAPDAGYWQAFALQRVGGDNSLRTALATLDQQQERFPRASTRGDATVLRTRIEGQLARLGDQNAITRLANRARGVTDEGCPRPQDDERIDALNALAQMDAEQALPNLRRVLARRDACTQQMRRTAVWLVASRVKPVDAAPILMSVAKTDPDREVREQAVFWMSNVPTEEATGMLIELAKKSEDIDMQKRAVYALSRSKSPRAATTLREIALDASAEVELRSDAVRYFLTGPARTSDDAMPFLKDVYGRADDSRFKESLLSIIGSRRNEDSRNFLVEIAQNSRESMETRRIAIWSLQSSGVTGAQLAVIYDRGTEVELRKQVISVLGNLKDNGGVDKLIDIARNDKNSELKKQAISSLQRTKDPRAVALLQEIINR